MSVADSVHLDDLPVGILVLDHEGVPQRANARACVLLLRPAGELCTGAWCDLVVEAERARAIEAWRQLRTTGRGFALACHLHTGDGATVAATVHCAPPRIDAPLLLSITEPTTPPSASRRHRTHLREARLALGQVLGVLGHELRTPLAGMRAMVEASRAMFAPETHELLDQILSDSVRMGEVVDNLLELSRLQFGQCDWVWRPIELDALLRSSVQRHRTLATGHAVTLVDPDANGVTMMGDTTAMTQVIDNLLTNAIVHARAARIVCRVVDRGDRVAIAIDDDGHGMPPALVDRLGEAFALNTGLLDDARGDGSGLGFALARELVAIHGGHLAVDSVEGRGTTVQVLLPRHCPAPIAPPDEGLPDDAGPATAGV